MNEIPHQIIDQLARMGYHIRLVHVGAEEALIVSNSDGFASAVVVEHNNDGKPDWDETLKAIKWSLEVAR